MSVNIVNPDGSLTQVSGGISQEILDAKANQIYAKVLYLLLE